MEKDQARKLTGWIAIIILVVNFTLFVFLRFNPLMFWSILILVCVIAFPLIKRLRASK